MNDLMNFCRKIFPISFREMDVKTFVITIVIYLAVGVVAGIVGWILGIIPFIGWFLKLIVDLVCTVYVVLGIIFAALVFSKVIEY